MLISSLMMLSVYLPQGEYDEEDHIAELELVKIKRKNMGAKDFFIGGDPIIELKSEGGGEELHGLGSLDWYGLDQPECQGGGRDVEREFKCTVTSTWASFHTRRGSDLSRRKTEVQEGSVLRALELRWTAGRMEGWCCCRIGCRRRRRRSRQQRRRQGTKTSSKFLKRSEKWRLRRSAGIWSGKSRRFKKKTFFTMHMSAMVPLGILDEVLYAKEERTRSTVSRYLTLQHQCDTGRRIFEAQYHRDSAGNIEMDLGS